MDPSETTPAADPAAGPAVDPAADPAADGAAEAAVPLDNRGLEPPMPMVRTLEAYGDLAPGGTLRIHNDRVPVYLLPQLEDRGAHYEVHEQPDGSAIVEIRKPADAEGAGGEDPGAA